MDVKVKTWRGVRETSLSDALTPYVDAYERDGQLERAECLAQKTAEAFGRLAELLVEKGVISLEEAVSASGVSADVEAL
ncbi:head vertex assembly chaperone [Xanthomonas phage Pfeifenkraut]|uniref:Head vertex assembly chaperone n=1 Tax=Xanthomonas phage Pfeifenkraut TaxID=2939132 RepID=A0A9E7E156_9CAUD|nr:head vertex assembly chaperone [Xanthomonas phage Pfeifenkraut]URA06950.1 head vertex assembly chaperone [Xanthomonas phage Pfeifenkraut]